MASSRVLLFYFWKTIASGVLSVRCSRQTNHLVIRFESACDAQRKRSSKGRSPRFRHFLLDRRAAPIFSIFWIVTTCLNDWSARTASGVLSLGFSETPRNLRPRRARQSIARRKRMIASRRERIDEPFARARGHHWKRLSRSQLWWSSSGKRRE